ncbi:serine/threonine protein kinase [Micromonospora nigra]|uniref:non-specific serine/threonine protein kinase n=1 Tax=Micromonospora nigra TaxID=145857 RepID=A0A1C6S161_9ACTN|nr:serine/threonine-protein kinase [Micromonospora nigra]SCL23113.1 serine/threonine protein kinase [Micromonospora nigra]
MLSPGVQLGNRYRLDERIASGGMGDVWRGTDQVLGRTVAVKSLLPALLDEPGFAERFRGEARTMATINHPGVVDVYDFGNDQQIAFLIMEYVEGDPLSATLSRVGRLTPARTMALVAQAADALHAAHGKGIVHRDVKPGNLLVRPNGTLVLTDFGIARSELVGQLTAAGSVLGTASYISPEQATGQVATPASDVYALGVVAYQCLAGRRPFEGDNPLEIAMRHVREHPRPLPPDIPPQVRAVVERAMAKDPAARWPSAAALSNVARQLKAQLSQQARAGGQKPVSGAPSSPAPAPGRAQVPSPSSPRPPAAQPPRPPVTAQPPRPPVSQPRPTVVAPAGHPHRPAAQASTGYPRGAAPTRPPAARPVAYAQSGPQPAPRRSRTGVWLLAVLLAALVLLCSGVISYKVREQLNTGAPVVDAPRTVTSDALRLAGRDDLAGTAYRRLDRVRSGSDETTTSEGRQTR